MSCGCTDPCQPNSIPCTCEARVTSDCVTVSGATSNCLAIDDNLLLTDYLTQMDERICEKVDSVTNFIALENVGTGSQLYKGDNLLGKKQIRTVKSLDSALIVTETVDEIQLDLNLPAIVPPDGTETKLVSGTNTTVAGNGSIATPYSVNVTLDGSETKVISGTNTTVTGLGTTSSPYVINSTDTIANGSETKINAGTNVTVTGNGTTATPYIINSSGGVTVNDATSSIKGILKLTGDLGGTADLPTTPTAIHKTGNETFTGLKTAISTNIERASIIMQNDSNTNSLLRIVNYSTAPNNTNGAEFYNNINSGSAIYVESSGSGAGILARITQGSSNTNVIKVDITSISAINDGCVYNASTSSNLINHLAFKVNNVNVATVSKNGNITANSYIKTGGTSTQMLMADGSVKENQGNLQRVITTSTVILDIDNNNTIFINNGATPITITIDSSITLPNFCVGFIQEGTGDVTFVGSGVSLTNPVGLKSKGQGYATFIERKLNTSNYFLLGDTKA